MNKVLLLLLITVMCAAEADKLDTVLQADNFECSNMEKMFNVKNQLLYWSELKDMDLVQQISDILEVKESLLNYKELIFNKQTVKKQGVKVLLEKIGKTITDIVHDLQGEKELTLEYCDSTIREINKILQQRDSEKAQLQKVNKETITSKLQAVTQQLDHCNRELKPAHHNQIILQQTLQSDKNQIVGYGYWFRILTFYPEEYKADGYFLSRVAENEKFSGDDLGDNKLLAVIKNNDLVLSTYDIKTMNSNIEQTIPIEKNKWTYIHFSYFDGQAAAYIFLDKDDISKVEFHVEHFKLSNAVFKFGGKDLNYEGLNGQFAQLTYGLGKQYVIDNPQAFIQEVQQLSPKPKFQKLEFELVSKNTEYPQEFVKEFQENFIDEFALSAWFKIEYLDAENIEIFRISDQHKYALSFFGGNSLSFGTYSIGQQLRKVELYEQTDDWHFIYMSYSYLKEEFNCFVWINGHIIKLQEHNVKHVPTTELKLTIEKEFDGEVHEMKLYIGEGSHINDPNQLPNEYKDGLDMVEKSVIRSFEVTNSQQAQTILAENSNLRKNKIVFEVNK